MSTKSRSYTELLTIPTFQERFEYLRFRNKIGTVTFGVDRYFNQMFYRSPDWKSVRNVVMVRDMGYDLGMEGYPIGMRPSVHHMNPITLEQVEAGDPDLLDPEYLILCSFDTHNAIHTGMAKVIRPDPIVRTRYDTCPWRS